MKESRWSDQDAQAYVEEYSSAPNSNEDVALRVYTSRLIGRDPSLVLHGGGNTSVKTRLVDDTGVEVDVLCVKGSGWDLGEIEPAGLPAVRLESLGALRSRESLSDEAMVNAQRTRLLDASAPNPSVETLLHAFLPAKFIDHSHADAILALVDQPEAEAICRDVYGEKLAIVPFVMPGFDLAVLAAEVQSKHPEAEGLLLLRHGLFTWGETARESYERHISAVDAAEAYIAEKVAATSPSRREVTPIAWRRVAPIVRGLLGEGERRYLLELRQSGAINAYLGRDDLQTISQRGTPTPDHVIRTKAFPLLLELGPEMSDEAIKGHVMERLVAYRDEYSAYVARQSAAKSRQVKSLDADPRVILIPGLGIVAAGATEKAARIAADLHEHTVTTIENAEAVGTYEVVTEGDRFDMEYWSLEQAKLGKKAPAPLEGRVVYITGAASGIGAATARLFAGKGARLHLVDRDAEALAEIANELGASADALDLCEAEAVEASIGRCVERFGGLDGIISNAGVAPEGAMHEVSARTIEASLAINLMAHQHVAAAATRVMRQQGMGGFLLFNASKAAFNPGKNFGPYAIAKAALVALMKQYALENGEASIRSNAINADRVRTGLLPSDFVAARAAARGLDADAYFRSNLLCAEVRAEDVARAFYDLALSERTSGCVLTVDGGNIAASPR